MVCGIPYAVTEISDPKLDETAVDGGLTPLSSPSRSELVADALRSAILKGDLEQGTPIVERDIANRLNVSKTPVREALRLLQSSGLIDGTPYRGVKVAEVTPDYVRSGYEMRLLLEPAATRLSCERANTSTAEGARTLFESALALAEAGDRLGLAIANRKFHRALYSLCGNDLLVPTLDALQDRMAFIAVAGWRRSWTWGDEAEEHLRILESIERDDSQMAERHAHEHVANSLARMTPPEESPDA